MIVKFSPALDEFSIRYNSAEIMHFNWSISIKPEAARELVAKLTAAIAESEADPSETNVQ